MNDKLLPLLGLCRRAGKILFGYDRTEKAVLSEKVFLVLTSSDFSERSREKLSRICEERGIQIEVLELTADELYYLLSYRAGVIAVADKGFADRIKQLL